MRIETGAVRERIELLAGEDKYGRPFGLAHRPRPRHAGFRAVGGTEQRHIRNQPERPGLLDRLMRRAVFTEEHGIVGEDEDGWNVHQCREADRRAFVVRENEECCSEGSPRAVERHSIHLSAHRMLPDAEIEVAALERIERRRIFGILLRPDDVGGLLDVGLRRGRQVRRATDKEWRDRRQFLNHLTG